MYDGADGDAADRPSEDSGHLFSPRRRLSLLLPPARELLNRRLEVEICGDQRGPSVRRTAPRSRPADGHTHGDFSCCRRATCFCSVLNSRRMPVRRSKTAELRVTQGECAGARARRRPAMAAVAESRALSLGSEIRWASPAPFAGASGACRARVPEPLGPMHRASAPRAGAHGPALPRLRAEFDHLDSDTRANVDVARRLVQLGHALG